MYKKLTFSKDAVFKKYPDIQIIKTDEGIIISPTSPKDDSIHYLENEVSFKIWNLFDGKNSVETIKQKLLSEYEISKTELEKDLNKFIKELYFKKLIVKC